MAERVYYLVFSNPVTEDRVDEFHAWYDDVHIPDVLAVPGLVSAKRISSRQHSATVAAPPAQFGVIYEIEGDPEEVMAEIRKRVASGEMTMSDVLDLSTFAMHFWDPRGEKVLAEEVRAGV